jgi:hypothetical protein
MGLLDEAIREHLDLKRRRGADPDEVERAEREALGPVRRQPQQADSGEPELAEAEHEAGAEQLQPPELSADSGEHYAPGVEAEPEPVFDDQMSETPPPVSGVPPAPSRAPGPETAEYDVEQEHREEEQRPPEVTEDVLEETPEFLQETPEHDRLWFEQRPPKDFDFEK